MPFMPIEHDVASKAEVAMRDARLYARALNGSEIKTMAAAGMECLDTEVNFDNSLWLSDFGQVRQTMPSSLSFITWNT
jgi:hypothetical protein